MRARAAVLGALACLALPAPASADLVEFSGRTGKQSGKAWFPEAGFKGYHLSVTVNGAVQGCRGSGRRRRCRIEVSVGEFFSTEGFPGGAKIVWNLRYRRRGGSWHRACVPESHNCEFTMEGGRSWPGNPAGGQYFPVRMWARRSRNVREVQVNWGAIIDKKHGTWVGGWPGSKTFRVRYFTGDGILPSSNTAPAPAPGSPPPPPPPLPPEPPPAPPPPPPLPPPPPPQDTCVGHPSDPSVVCTRDGGHIVDVCDRDTDGHRAYARVVTEATHPNFRSPFYDDNDSRPGCANIRFASRVTGIAVCVQFESCSAIKPTGPQPGR